MENNVFYRPPWTCGKYNAEKHVAIMFNLINNSEYFFESDSADVIGIILCAGHNGSVVVDEVSKRANITTESLLPFFKSLIDYGLLSLSIPEEEEILDYRRNCIPLTDMSSNKDANFEENSDTPEATYVNVVSDCIEIENVMFELTYRCSQQCIHCYNPGATRNNEEKCGRGNFSEMGIDDYKRIIDEMSDAGLVRVNISGGDPFSKGIVWDILDYLYKKDIQFTIFTNGIQLFNQVERLANLYPRQIRISLYSTEPQIHDSITRVDGSWDKTMKTIAELRNLSIPVVLVCVVMQPNYKSCLGIKNIGEKYGCQVVYEVCVTDSIDGDICPTKNLRLTPEQLEIISLDDSVMPKELRDILPKSSPQDGLPCRAGGDMFCVTPDGNLIPCSSFHLILGNLMKNSFQDIVNNNNKLQQLRNTKATQYEECWTHEYCEYCNFCVGNNYNEHKTIYKASENGCYIAKAHYNLALKINKKIDPLGGKSIQECIAYMPDYVPVVLHRIKRVKGAPESPLTLINK